MTAPGPEPEALLAAAEVAARHAYAPYSHFAVGAALGFADGAIVTGANVENASYGLSLCAEAVAVAKAMAEGRRGGLTGLAVVNRGRPITPCGRCRQLLSELAWLDGRDPLVFGDGAPLSQLLPRAFTGEQLG